MRIELRSVEAGHPDLRQLVAGLDAFFLDRYGPATRKYQKYHDLTQMACTAVLYVEDRPAACCCWRPIDRMTAEIKRLFVLPEYRRQGLARRLVETMERQAAATGCRRAVLETGSDMTDAIAVYTCMGYRICPNYGDFAGDRYVVCMEKDIPSSSV